MEKSAIGHNPESVTLTFPSSEYYPSIISVRCILGGLSGVTQEKCNAKIQYDISVPHSSQQNNTIPAVYLNAILQTEVLVKYSYCSVKLDIF
jgi:hypothetical protein